MKLNNKGFTLVEVLAVIVILGILVAFMYPNVTNLINKNREDNYQKLNDTIISAAKMYLSDYRYEISIDSDGESITKIGNETLTNKSIIPISILVSEGNIKTNKQGNIENPKNKEQCLNLTSSNITVKYDENKKDFNYSNPELVWESCD